MAPVVSTKGLKTAPDGVSALAASQWAGATGSADVLQAAFPVAVTALYDGLILGVRAAYANLTTIPVFAPDAMDAKTIVKANHIPLKPGDIRGSGQELLLRYNLSSTVWELLNPYVPFRDPTAYYAVDTGSANALVVAFTPAFPSLIDGTQVVIQAGHDNTITAPTFAPDGFTPRIIYKGGKTALIAGDIKAGGDLILTFHDDTTDWWELANPAPDASKAGTFAAASGTDTITATFSPAHTALVDGLQLTVRAANANVTVVPTFEPDSLGAKIIYKKNKAALAVNDIVANLDMILVFHDDTIDWWELVNPTGGEQRQTIVTDDNSNTTNDTAANAWFPAANDAVQVGNATEYEFEGVLKLSRSAGSTSHTTSVLFGGTATYDTFTWDALALQNDDLSLAAPQQVTGADATTAVVVKAASTSTTEQTLVRVKGRFKVAAAGAGTLIPQFKFSAAPGQVPTRKIGTRFTIRPSPVSGQWS